VSLVRNMMHTRGGVQGIGRAFTPNWAPRISHNPSKIASKIDEKINAKNMLKIHEQSIQNAAKIDAEVDPKRMRVRDYRFLVFCKEYNVKFFFLHEWVLNGVSEIPQQSIKYRCQIRYRKRYAKSMPKLPKTEATIR